MPGFETWHRAYVKAFERALQCVNSNIMLPFWDWSSGPTTGVPAACAAPTYVNRDGDTVPNPLYSGPISSLAGGGMTGRRPDIDTTSFAGPATSAQSAMSSTTTFDSYQVAMNGPHGWVHGLVGGQMGSVPRAAFDPIFYLHHCNVDRLWWNWQQAHPWATLPASEASHELDPFNKPFSSDWYVGSDVESTDDLGYRYTNWCLWIPPIVIWEPFEVKLDPWMIGQLRNARLVIRSSRMAPETVEFRLFINQSRATHRTKTEDNPSFAGSAVAFGMGDMQMETRSTSKSFDLDINITELVRSSLAEDAQELELKIVALNAEGEPVEADRLDVDDIELIFE